MHSDREIVGQVLGGDRQAYAQLVDRYERLVRGIALRIARDRHAAEDIAQEAFVYAFEQLASLRDPASFPGWLVAIARRTATKAQARQRRAPTSVGDVSAFGCNPISDLSGPSHELLDLIERLPEHEQSVVALRYLNGHSVAEIAAITARPIGTITKQLSRACERLRSWLEQENQ